MPASLSRMFFIVFWISGFCSLLYQTVWLRLAYASFGVITPVLSVVLSVFMLGLSLGSWAGGKLIEPASKKTGLSPLWLYALTELVIGVGALAVPAIFKVEEQLLQTSGQSDSLAYLGLSAVMILVALLPWATAMGCTFPFAMAYLKERGAGERTFSYLYLANLLGAISGTLLTAFVLIELLGFKSTLLVGAGANVLIAVLIGTAFIANKGSAQTAGTIASENTEVTKISEADPTAQRLGTVLLWTTGIACMAMEVVWIRIFTPILGNAIYAFATILFVYLLATTLGARRYRWNLTHGKPIAAASLLGTIAISALLPAVLNDARLLSMFGGGDLVMAVCAGIALMSIVPVCFGFGYLTPLVIDTVSRGDPRIAGRAYAFNGLGCVIGPLVASYLLLPVLGARLSLVVLALPFVYLFLTCKDVLSKTQLVRGTSIIVALAAVSLLFNRSYEEPLSTQAQVFRDHTATVVAYGEGLNKELTVNGRRMTNLRPFIKLMVHMPIAFHKGPVHNALIICFGMGTTYRSLLSWDNVNATAVELVPGVTKAFTYFHKDAPEILSNTKGKIVVDDGRRFLARSNESFDIITIDPPPPVEAAGSSLLYSEDFYKVIKAHLSEGGIVQQWFGCEEPKVLPAVCRALKNNFQYIRVFKNSEGWGYHFLASNSPLENLTSQQICDKFPPKVKLDIGEWDVALDNKETLQQLFDKMLAHEVKFDSLLDPDTSITITDDRPLNEYCVLRRIAAGDRESWNAPKVVK